MGQFISNMQYRVKSSSLGMFTLMLKIVTGLMLGLTLALIAQEILGFGQLSFILFIVVFASAFLKTAWRWNLGGVLIFNLICVLVAVLLRAYILVAPGA